MSNSCQTRKRQGRFDIFLMPDGERSEEILFELMAPILDDLENLLSHFFKDLHLYLEYIFKKHKVYVVVLNKTKSF